MTADIHSFVNPVSVRLLHRLLEYRSSWNVDRVASVGRHSNPSKIPYSEITIENAAEAFPYLGFIGYRPEYIEIFPDDSEEKIASKIFANACGTRCLDYYGYGLPTEVPTHSFATEQDYLDYVAEQKAIADAQNAAVDAGRAEEGGRFNITQKEFESIWTYD